MTQKINLRKCLIVLGLPALILFNSCIPQKRILYFQDKDENISETEFALKKVKIIVRPGDELYIRILSVNNETSDIFNSMIGNQTSGNYLQYGGAYISSFTVNDSGNIDFPFIGSFPVAGKTLDEVKGDLYRNLSEYLKYITVVVKYVNFKVSVLGEVENPGHFDVYNDNVTLFEILSMAGDLTEYGNRNNIAIIRQNGDKQEIHYLDITQKDIMESEYFYLMPNDVIYVSPMASKAFGLRNFQLQTFLSLILSSLTLFVYLKSLK